MKQENRHQAILYAVMRQGYVSIESLAEELGVSSQTIRRDISELDRTGMLERRPGGASCRTTILNSTYDARQVEDFKDKERIARTIAEYIPDNSSIFLTLGTTVEVIAYALLERSGLMVITNNVVAALTLNKKTDFEVVLASGYMRKSSNGLVGESTIEFVNGFQCDYVITSTGGISEADGHLLDYPGPPHLNTVRSRKDQPEIPSSSAALSYRERWRDSGSSPAFFQSSMACANPRMG